MQFPIWRYSTVLVKRTKYFSLVLCVVDTSAWFWPLERLPHLDSGLLIGIGRSVDLGQCLVSLLGIDGIQIHQQSGLELLFCPGFLSGHQQGQPQM
jgi:hypothetical protein